jgi:hypothetical protein
LGQPRSSLCDHPFDAATFTVAGPFARAAVPALLIGTVRI